MEPPRPPSQLHSSLQATSAVSTRFCARRTAASAFGGAYRGLSLGFSVRGLGASGQANCLLSIKLLHSVTVVASLVQNAGSKKRQVSTQEAQQSRSAQGPGPRPEALAERDRAQKGQAGAHSQGCRASRNSGPGQGGPRGPRTSTGPAENLLRYLAHRGCYRPPSCRRRASDLGRISP